MLEADFKELAEASRILEIRCGSHLFGTDTPESDLDLIGIFMPFSEMLFGLRWKAKEEAKFDIPVKDASGRNTSEAIDRTLHEYRRFCRLALQNNPNILHVLFVDDRNIRFINDFGQKLLYQAEIFPHQGLYDRFMGYAQAQKHKMVIRRNNFNALRQGLEVLTSVDDFKTMAELRDTRPFKYEGKGKHIKCGDLSFEAGIYAKKAKRILSRRLAAASQRTGLITKYGFDTKYASNLIQLLMEGVELLKTGRIEFPLKYAQDILDIKHGRYKIKEIMKWSVDLENENRAALKETKIPKKPRSDEIEKFIISEMRTWVKRL